MAHVAAEESSGVVAASAPAGHLLQRVFVAGRWVALSHATSQAIRFGANLVLARLLFPGAL